MYPLHMKSAAGGFALANTEDEHRALSASGYEPKLVEPEAGDSNAGDDTLSEFEQLKAQAEARGIKVPGNWGVKKLRDYLAS